VIRKVGKKWVLYTATGKKRLGTHDSRASAERQEVAINLAKRRRK
jgi:hypothetical protein